jgi:hypothetical protein
MRQALDCSPPRIRTAIPVRSPRTSSRPWRDRPAPHCGHGLDGHDEEAELSRPHRGTLRCRLAVRELQAPAARLERAPLAVAHRDVASFRSIEVEPAGGQVLELEAAAFVSGGTAALTHAFGRKADHGASQGRTILAADHASGDMACACIRLLFVVARACRGLLRARPGGTPGDACMTGRAGAWASPADAAGADIKSISSSNRAFIARLLRTQPWVRLWCSPPAVYSITTRLCSRMNCWT